MTAITIHDTANTARPERVFAPHAIPTVGAAPAWHDRRQRRLQEAAAGQQQQQQRQGAKRRGRGVAHGA